MAAELVFVGGGLESAVVVSGTVTEGNTAGWFDATYVDSYLLLATNAMADFFLLDGAGVRTTIIDGETCFTHFEMRTQFTGAVGAVYMYWYDDDGFPWLRLMMPTTGTWQFQYNSNTGASPTWTAIEGTTASNTSALVDYNIRIKIDTAGSHEAELFLSNNSVINVNFTQPLFTNIDRVRARGGSGNCGFSQVMVGRDLATVGGKVKYHRPTGAGNANTWTDGDQTDIDEAVNNDTDIMLTTGVGDDFTFVYSDTSIPVNYYIESVFTWARAKHDGVSPTNLKTLCRNGGTTFASTNNVAGLGLGFAGVGMRYDVDPDTTAEWSEAGFNTAEWGLRSAA